ncbi:hypothetical protein [Paenilisteria newyorkensis]|uniref:hypothetical protein n=1 Tax=Listeria newyorkensis TaxID=1497681 RepID=UPI000669DC64|nr:hypothetical protein [Listeria newyorkensis]KMT62685.1 hypothetical protein X559_0968 [Listeria newyorkensis]
MNSEQLIKELQELQEEYGVFDVNIYLLGRNESFEISSIDIGGLNKPGFKDSPYIDLEVDDD